MQKITFSVVSQKNPFLGRSKNSLFWQLGPKKRAPRNTKIVFFRWLSKNEKNKNGFLAKIAWHNLRQEGRKNAHFRAHYLFWPKFFGSKTVNTRKTITMAVSAEIAQNLKWHHFLAKGVFGMGEKVFFNCVFEKLRFLKH